MARKTKTKTVEKPLPLPIEEAPLPLATIPEKAAIQPPPRGTMDLIAMAVERGSSPAELEQLVNLTERVQKIEAEKAFANAMAICQAQLPKVIKRKKNEHTSSRFAPVEDILEQLMPVVTTNGFSIMFSQAECGIPGKIRMTADVRHKAGHSVRYEVLMSCDGAGAKGGKPAMNAIQADVSTHTYSMRNLLRLIFPMVIAGTDDDGNSATTLITEVQLGELNDLVRRSGADLTRFLQWLCVEELAKLPAKKFEDAKHELNRKLERTQQRAQQGQAAQQPQGGQQ